ncbi:TraB/GumN family protein [Marinicella meishanensis]|uniref:TraB/GumN family protein n=1 Tax=Marinicella meishanensis TaxID=2873263 RepID=UPI001CBB49A2|nr:TraB/GumN family protein [Marinicella sp. NBU2979]
MENKLITLILFALFTTVGHSSESTNKANSSMIWEITGPGIEQASYVAGTVHVMCEKDHRRDPRFAAAMEQVDQLYLEIHLEDPSVMMSVMITDVPLEERLSPVQYEQLKGIIGQYTDFDISMFKNMEMFAISAMLLMTSLECPIVGVEEDLETQAQAIDMPIKSLETLDEQVAVMRAMDPPKSGEPWSEEELKAYGMVPEMFREMLDLYYAEDINDIHQMTIREISKVHNGAELIDVLLDARNKNWVKKMPQIMQQNPTLFAVGAAHLGGPNGVVNLLKEAGYQLKPVKP